MKIFISGETSPEIGFFEALRQIMQIETFVLKKKYGSGVEFFGIVVMIMTDEHLKVTQFEEFIRYSPKKKEAEARLKTDYDTFKNATLEKKVLLLLENIIRSIRAIAQHIPEGFDAQKFEKDILTLYDIKDYAHLQEKIQRTL